jgi:hypothetical protein
MDDWEVRETLEAWASDVIAGSTTIGRATGEPGGFRGPGVAFRDNPIDDNRPNDQRLACALVTGKAKGLA